MTSLERLIKLASTDGAAHYRELAVEAQAEYLILIVSLEAIAEMDGPCTSIASGALGVTRK